MHPAACQEVPDVKNGAFCLLQEAVVERKKRGMATSKQLPVTAVLRNVRSAYWALLACGAIAAASDSVLIGAADFFPAQFAALRRTLAPIVVLVSPYVWAFHRLRADLDWVHRGAALDLVSDVLAVNYALYATSIVVIAAVAVIGCARDRKTVARSVRATVALSGLSRQSALFWYAAMSVAALFFFYSGIGYEGPVDLYSNDLLLLGSLFWWWYSVATPIALLLLAFAYVGEWRWGQK